MIQIVDYATIEPFSFRAPTAADFSWGNRFQIVALDDHGDPSVKANLIGRWEFTLVRLNWGANVILSTHTWVSGRVRREGIGRKLWRAGVDRWEPYRVKATIGTWQGLEFLARMRAELAGKTILEVDAGRTSHGSLEWQSWPDRAAEELERELVRERTNAHVARRRLEVVK